MFNMFTRILGVLGAILSGWQAWSVEDKAFQTEEWKALVAKGAHAENPLEKAGAGDKPLGKPRAKEEGAGIKKATKDSRNRWHTLADVFLENDWDQADEWEDQGESGPGKPKSTVIERIDPFPFRLRMPSSPFAPAIGSYYGILDSEAFQNHSDVKSRDNFNVLGLTFGPRPELDVFAGIFNFSNRHLSKKGLDKGKASGKAANIGFGYRYHNLFVMMIEAAAFKGKGSDEVQTVMPRAGMISGNYSYRAKGCTLYMTGESVVAALPRAFGNTGTLMISLQGSFSWQKVIVDPFYSSFAGGKVVLYNKVSSSYPYIGQFSVTAYHDMRGEDWEVIPMIGVGTLSFSPHPGKVYYEVISGEESPIRHHHHHHRFPMLGSRMPFPRFPMTAFRALLGVTGNKGRFSYCFFVQSYFHRHAQACEFAARISYSL